MKHMNTSKQSQTRYSLASSSWDEKEIQAIHNVIESDMYSMGKQVAEYEKQFAKAFDSKYAVMVNSGSSANLLMIASLFFRKENRLKRGDEIIVPAVSWSTTYAPLQQYGLKVKFIDIDKDTLNMDLNVLRDAVTEDTKAILSVNLLGNPIDYDELMEIVGDRILIEDNCESMGAMYKGKAAGSYGLMGSFSSYFSHHISTMEGGCVVTDDEELYHIMLSVRSHGWTRGLPQNNKLVTKSDNAFEESFRFILPGYNIRPIEMSGAIGIEQLKKLPSMVAQRRDNAKFFKELMSDLDGVRTQQEVGESSWFGFSLIVDDRDDLIKVLDKNQIECRPIVSGNFLKNKELLEYFDYEVYGDLVNAEEVESNGLFIGNCHSDLTEQIKKLREII